MPLNCRKVSPSHPSPLVYAPPGAVFGQRGLKRVGRGEAQLRASARQIERRLLVHVRPGARPEVDACARHKSAYSRRDLAPRVGTLQADVEDAVLERGRVEGGEEGRGCVLDVAEVRCLRI